MRSQLVKTLTDIASEDRRLVVLLADFAEYQFRHFKEKFPDRLINCGIREQTMVGVAAGMALSGLIPVCYTIAPFIIERAYEQIKLDLCYQGLGAILIGYGDNQEMEFYGPSHQCWHEHILIGKLPNTRIHIPRGPDDLDKTMKETYSNGFTKYWSIYKL